MNLLEVKDLAVQFATQDGTVYAVNGLSFALAKGQTLGIVGESGSGKSQTVLALMGLLARNGSASGQALYHGKNLLTLPATELNQIRGNRMAMIFQDPMTSLNPYLTVERQMTEVLQLHKGQDRTSARAASIRMLDAVRIPEAAKRVDMYPHEFSGGMRQRVMIAMALLCEPEVLIADEPTTALDVTVQAQMLLLLRDLQQDFGTAIVLITHDLGVVAGLCDQVVVMYGGRVMEQGNAQQLFKSATHPYTRGLLQAVPRMDGSDAALLAIPGAPPNMAHLPKGCPFSPRCAFADVQCHNTLASLQALTGPAGASGHLRACHREVTLVQANTPRRWPMSDSKQPILSVRDLKVEFQIKDAKAWPWTPTRSLKAVNGISFDLYAGETLGVVGESGCGKSTLARALLNLNPANSGSIRWMGQEMQGATEAAWLSVRKDIQMIFQDPLASLDPRMTVAQIIAEPLRTHHPELSHDEVMTQVRTIMGRVGLTAQQINRYPHEFSGGQCQRIGIARALILQPKLIVCDEPVSALDVSIQAQIINLLKELQAEFGLALIFIAHDLAVVRHISHRIMVMYLGRAMEVAGKHALYDDPSHPYTQALLSAIPIPDPDLERGKVIQLLQGDLPSPLNPPSGCVFRTRCPKAQAHCADSVPSLKVTAAGSQAACILV